MDLTTISKRAHTLVDTNGYLSYTTIYHNTCFADAVLLSAPAKPAQNGLQVWAAPESGGFFR